MFERSYLQNIIVNAPIGIITTDTELEVTFISDSARKALGIQAVQKVPDTGIDPSIRQPLAGSEESFGPVADLVSSPDEMMRCLSQVMRQEREILTFEMEAANEDGNRTVQFTCSLLRDDSYVPIGLLLMCQDVTVQRETDRKYRNVMANSIDAVFIYKGEAIVEVNPAFTGLTGKELSAGRLLRWSDFVHPDSLEQVLENVRKREKGDTEVPDKFECSGIAADGTRRCWTISISPIYPSLGIYFALIHDQTEQKVLQQQLMHTRKMETVSLMAGGIAHDFNNLLTGVLGYSSLIKRLLNPEDQIFGYINSIESSALHAKELNDQLVAFARLGKYGLTPLDLNREVEKTLRLLRLTLDKKVSIEDSFGADLMNIEASAAQIQQLITNICINSIEAMPDGGTIVVRTESASFPEPRNMGEWNIPAGDYVKLSISDTGRGIAPESIGKIFEPFYSTKGMGFGLGLAAAYGIVKGHNGYISAESTPGEGTEIQIYLPAVESRKEPEKKPARICAKEKARILIVDDEAVVREILGDILHELGCETMTADDGEKAIPMFKEHGDSIDMVFLDMIMPHMNGEETFQALKEINPNVKVVVCTGYTDEGPIQDMLKKGALMVIKKPFRMDDIQSALAQVLSS